MRRIGLIASTFDLLHAGHIHFIRECRRYCDELVCALQTDVTDRPNKNRPVQTVYERFTQLSAVQGVGRILPYQSETDLLNLLGTTPHHYRFLGADYFPINAAVITGFPIYQAIPHFVPDLPENVSEMDPVIVFVNRRHSFSTTELRKRVKDAEG